jgi:hypothetical protein
MNAALGDEFAALIDQLFASDEATDGRPELPEQERAHALAYLERLVLDRRALDEYIRFLQKRFGRSFRHQELLPTEESDRFLRSGAHVLSNGQLAALLLNTIALCDLASQINEELPDYWLDRMSILGQARWQVELGEGSSTKPPQLPPVKESVNTPNLFDYATSELSQDAFLCWLLRWADLQYRDSDYAPLHKTAIALLNKLLALANVEPPAKYTAVQIEKQYRQIDVLVLVNSDIALLIEDKTCTKEHSDQLRRYLKTVQESYPHRKVAAIYLKTGEQSDYTAATEAGYGCFLRPDLLGILEEGERLGVVNDIYRDFLHHLRYIDQAVNSFRSLPIGQWPDSSPWTGFFVALQDRLGEGEWGYVPFPGDFMGFWWHWKGNKYLQLEEAELCFKIHVPEKAERARAWQNWHEALMIQARKAGLPLKRPGRRGSGNFMTVAVLDGDYRQAHDRGILDFEKTVSLLRQAESLFDSAL